MSKKIPAKKTVKKTVKKVMKAAADPAVVAAARNKYRQGPKLPKARTAGR